MHVMGNEVGVVFTVLVIQANLMNSFHHKMLQYDHNFQSENNYKIQFNYILSYMHIQYYGQKN